MKRLISPVILFAMAFLFTSHELFLKTDAYFLEPGQASELYLFNGTFDQSENTIARGRIVDATVIGPDYEVKPGLSDFYDKGDITFLKFESGASGTYVAGISTLPRLIELNAKDFNEYLTHEGLEDVIAEREKEGIDTTGAMEKYSKHVKTLLQVGDGHTEEYSAVLGYPIEFVPMVNPYQVGVGQPVPFKLLRNGIPLTNQVVHYSMSEPGMDAHENEQSTKTNDQGIMTMTPIKPGKWYVATIHMEKSAKDGLDYESNWATLTFAVK